MGLLPLAMAAGLLSGGLLRQPPAPEPARTIGKPAERPPDADSFTTPWLSDLRPVMDVLADAMGLATQRDAPARVFTSGASALDTPSPLRVAHAIATMRRGIGVESEPQCQPVAAPLTRAERTLDAYLLAEKDPGGSSRQLRVSVAESLLEQLQDWRAFQKLTGDRAARYSVGFIVATIPDYVDSNAGWLADQGLAAIQSAMGQSGYLLDRFRLIDWTRTDPRSDNPVASDSRLHERQPGALIFRKFMPRDASHSHDEVRLQVVLLVLETPTSGVHRSALRNAVRFVRAWNRCTGGGAKRRLDVLGPTFSGSALSVALTLGDRAADDRFSEAFDGIRVISGSATADENVETFRAFAPGVSFSTTIEPTSENRRVMAAFLEGMNPQWRGGRHVAILKESNTAYGRTLIRENGRNAAGDPFEYASVFTFPLHVSQLRSDVPAVSATATLLPAAGLPLNLRETTPAADQIPALRPQLVSPVVESAIDSIFDTIRHEHLTAVGIQATDERDVLFLARELKRAAPDVQLFFFGSHAVYLHQDYIPYLRGTLIASTYPLSLTTQSGFAGKATGRRREPFQSMGAEGVYNAVLLLMAPDDDSPDEEPRRIQLVDYCGMRTAASQCAPKVSVSVIGEDGFWPVPGTSAPPAAAAQLAVVDGLTSTVALPPLPKQARIIATLAGLFVFAHVLMMIFMARQMRQGASPQTFLEWPMLRVFAPPIAGGAAASLHRVGLVLCFLVLAALSTWLTAIVVPFVVDRPSRLLVEILIALAAAAVLLPIAFLPTALATAHDRAGAAAAQKPTRWLLTPILALLMISLAAFVAHAISSLVPNGDNARDVPLTLARLVGGGIVSPAPATLCLFAALYAAMFAAIRRTALTGRGYATLDGRSAAFDLLNGPAADEPHALAAGSSRGPGWSGRARVSGVMDMPAQNLPLSYVLGILLVLLIASFSLLQVTTIDGMAFSWFFRAASATVLMLGLSSLAQGLAIWSAARVHLTWLAQSPIERAFTSIGRVVPWDISLAPPRLVELMPVARRADALASQYIGAGLPLSETFAGSHVLRLRREIARQPHAAFTQSSSWFELWRTADVAVELLMNRGIAAPLSFGTFPATGPETADGPSAAEEFVALQFAFVVRDIVARTVAALFTAMLCLTCLTAAHLLYSFNGRSSMLSMDLFAVAGASLGSIWILVDMERETVLSRLRNTTPGSLDINWTFVQRVAIYGVLPLLAVIAYVFPEIGSSLLGWLEPVRQLTRF